MRKIYIPVYLILALSTGVQAGFAQGTSWYKCFGGTIGKTPVVIHLHKMEHQFAGYYYDGSQVLIYMTGNDTSEHDGKIRLYPNVPGMESDIVTMALTLSGKNLKGNWKKNETSPSLPVLAAEKSALPVSFDMYYIWGREKLKRKSLTEQPESFYDAGTLWPRQNTPVVDSVKKMILNSFEERTAEKDIKKVMSRQKTLFITGWLEENKNVPDSDMVDYPYSYNMEESHWMLVAYQSAKLLTLADWFYTYAGGAHGNSSTSYTVFDMASGKRLGLGDIIQPAGMEKLNPLLEKYFRISRRLKPGEDLTEGGLFENKLEYNSNFYITGKGIGFSYAPYEVASYADGQVEVFIPFTELTKYLQPGFRKLMQ